MALLGLRSLIYPVDDLAAATKWWSDFLGREPYFNEAFYVGFDVGGYEIGLNPGAPADAGPVTYLGVDDMDGALRNAQAAGATVESPPEDVGEGIVVATLVSATQQRFGLIFNPHFSPK